MNSFKSLFGFDPTTQGAAPGRVNLIGEHTDYNGGYVLPTPIPQHTHVQLRQRPDNLIRAASANTGVGIQTYELGQEHPVRGWLDYVQGTTALLRQDGHGLGGFDLLIASDVPPGSGLSSSAALGVALLRALREAFALPLDDRDIAQHVQRVENQFVGAQVGIMDPMACSLGEPGSALFLDTRTLQGERVPLPTSVDWVIINSGVSHQHAAGDYNSRRAECDSACERLGVRQLRDLGPEDLGRVAQLPEPLNRRARHVITENARVLDAVAALRKGDAAELGRLFDASHDSQCNDYEVSVPAIEALVERARREPGVYGARLTGGGFGGSVVLFTRAGQGRGAAAAIVADYAARTGHKATVLVPPPVA